MPKAIRQRLSSDQRLTNIYHKQSGIKSGKVTHSRIADSKFIIIDTETTGFHAYAGDEIISIAMLEYRGLEATGNIYQSLINPQRLIPEESTTIHGITDADVKDAPKLKEILADILEFIDDGTLVGHHVQFDIRFLNKTLKPYLGLTLQNNWLDTMLLFLAHEKRLGHYQLDEVATHCGITIHDRHTALGDARAAADLFIHLCNEMITPSEPLFSLINQQVKKDGL